MTKIQDDKFKRFLRYDFTICKLTQFNKSGSFLDPAAKKIKHSVNKVHQFVCQIVWQFDYLFCFINHYMRGVANDFVLGKFGNSGERKLAIRIL